MIYHFTACAYDTERHELWRDNRKITVERQVREVLQYFLQHRHRVISRDELLEQCWAQTFVSDAAVNSCLSRLRQALGQIRGGATIIQTVHGAGYRFVAEVSEADSLPPSAEAETAQVSQLTSEFPSQVAPPHEPALAAPEAAPPGSGTERRQLTVLSCALAHADTLIAKLDEETLHDLMQQLRTLHLDLIEHFEGYVAQYGMASWLVYFGYPMAHEDDTQRAIHTGLALIEQLQQMEAAWDTLSSGDLAIRVGIHTGGVIVEATPTSTPVVVGMVPSLALRVQEAAPPQTVVISSATAHLVHGHMICQELAGEMSGAAGETFGLYEVQGLYTPKSSAQAASDSGLTPFVGREAEIGLLQERWEQVGEGQGQVVLIRGEAGIGKSRLVQEFKGLARPHLQMECRCSPYHQNTAFYPLAEALQRAMAWEPEAPAEAKWAALERVLSRFQLPVAPLAPLLAELLGFKAQRQRDAPLPLPPQQRRQQLLDGLLQLILGQALAEPLLLIVENIHWSDASTLEFLTLLIEQAPSVSLLVVLTCRPAFEPSSPFRIKTTPIALNRLTRGQVQTLVSKLASGQELSALALELIIDKSDGVPLFAEELTRMVVETARLGTEPSAVSIPSTLQDLLTARLDRLDGAKAVAQWGAVIGRRFSYEMLAAVAPFDKAMLTDGLQRLVQAELLHSQGIEPHTMQYRFKHALIQEAAYASMPKRRRQAMHEQIARVLETQFPSLIETQPELLARHATEAGLPEQAILYWQ